MYRNQINSMLMYEFRSALMQQMYMSKQYRVENNCVYKTLYCVYHELV